MRFNYRPIVQGTAVVEHWDLRSGRFYEQLNVPLAPRRLQAVFVGNKTYIGYLIQIGFDLHAIAPDGTRVSSGAQCAPTNKHKAANWLWEYAQLKRELKGAS